MDFDRPVLHEDYHPDNRMYGLLNAAGGGATVSNNVVELHVHIHVHTANTSEPVAQSFLGRLLKGQPEPIRLVTGAETQALLLPLLEAMVAGREALAQTEGEQT